MSKVKVVGEDEVLGKHGGTTEQPHAPTLPELDKEELDLNATVKEDIVWLEGRAKHIEQLIENVEKL